MEKNINLSVDVNNKSNTFILRDYLESAIADEMILNSYIRDINIIDASATIVLLEVSSNQARNIIENEYSEVLKKGIESVYEKPLEYELILKNEKKFYESKTPISAKNISKKFLFDTYVQSDFNNEVVDMARKTSQEPGRFSPLYIASKSGLGKTHLLHAIGNEATKNGYSSIYIEPNGFTKRVVDASKAGGDAIDEIVNEYKQYDILLFDDIQSLGDRVVTLKVLFEIINNHTIEDKQIVIVSDRVAQELSGFESRFITRFVSGISSTIKEPSEEDVEKILKFKLLQEKMNPEEWEKSALSFVARNNTSSIRALEGAIKRIVYYTENKKNIRYTYNVVTKIFKDLAIDPSELTPTRIISVVASYYNINKKDIIGKSRKKEYVVPRHIAIYLIREITPLGLADIGKEFGGRDHSTILNAIKTIDQNMKIDKAVRMAISSIEQKIKTIN